MIHLRSPLLALFLFGVVGLGVELWLLGHYEERWQPVPLVLLGLGLVAGGICAPGPGRRRLQVLRGVAVAMVAAGFLGLWLHYRGNVEFEKEMYPGLRGFGLFKEAMQGATPALAPGALVQLGLLGLLYGYRHPASRATDPPDENDA